MSNQQTGPKPEGQEGLEAKIGQMLQQARLGAHIEVNKICADLRISPQALEAIEQGNYHLLPGDPYVRALLGSMSRYLNVDSQAVIRGYNKEIGATAAAPSAVAPYNQENAQTHKTAHKQIFVAIVIALFVVLFFVVGRLNKGEPAPQVPGAPAHKGSDSLATPRQDTSLEGRTSLAPDSMLGKAADTAKKDSTHAPKAAAAAASTKPAADTAGLNVATIKPLLDSIGVRVVRSGKEDVAVLLRLGKQMQVSHGDTILVYTTKRRSVEVTVGGVTVTPDRKRFKIYGHTVKPF